MDTNLGKYYYAKVFFALTGEALESCFVLKGIALGHLYFISIKVVLCNAENRRQILLCYNIEG